MVFQNFKTSHGPENCIVKRSLIVSSETLKCYFTVHHQYAHNAVRMTHLLESEVFIRGRGWETGPPLSEFSGSAPVDGVSLSILVCNKLVMTE